AGSDEEVELDVAGGIEESRIVPRGTGATGHRVRVPGRRLELLLHGIKHVDLLKVDIEGSEVAMFRACPDGVLQAIDQITIEFHDFCGLVSKEEIDEIRERLALLGFDGLRMSTNNKNWLFIRRSGVATLRRLYVKYLMRPARNALHWVQNQNVAGAYRSLR